MSGYPYAGPEFSEFSETIRVACPHCLGQRGSCHVCKKKRRIPYALAMAVVGWAWATPNCKCRACIWAGPPPETAVDWEAA
jgi:hypothetical protein